MWWWRWWWSLLVVMSGKFQCQRQKKMMGRGAEGGCGTEERPCRPAVPEIQPKISEDSRVPVYVDFFSQARKALTERSPFAVSENGSFSETHLPSGLASLLKQSDSRKRHKKSHSGADKKSAGKIERLKGPSIWVETEEYFRYLALPDVDALSEVASFSSLARKKCFLIPFCGNDNNANVNVTVSGGECVSFDNGGTSGIVAKEEIKEEENKEDEKQPMDIDSLVDDSLMKKDDSSNLDSYVGVEWLLGCRSRTLLTSERPSKKRKLLGSDAGLEKILIGCPCDGNSSLCDFCCSSDMGVESNRLVVCSSCKVAVHRKCYGVQDGGSGSWLCSWCKESGSSGYSVKQPCMLCPKQGGALKPVTKVNETDDSGGFAHLFCSLMMPEVYIDDMKNMEPIMNVGGIKETKMKLVCNVCKLKCGACVRCSHGSCRASFHPVCAREARHRLEVWGKFGCDNVELRAFCSKHSEALAGGTAPSMGNIAAGSDSLASNPFQGTSMNKLQKLKIDCKNSGKNADHTSDAKSERYCENEERELSDSRLNGEPISECGGAQELPDVGILDRSSNELVNLLELNYTLILNKLIDRGKVDMNNVASEIGMSPDSLTTILANGNLDLDLRFKLAKWLNSHAYLGAEQTNFNFKLKSNSAKLEAEATESDGVVSETDISDPVAVKSVPPRRRTKGSIRILRDNRVICSPEEIFAENGMSVDQVKLDLHDREEPVNSSEVLMPDTDEKNSYADGFEDSLTRVSPKSEGSSAKPSGCSVSEGGLLEEAAMSGQHSLVTVDHDNRVCLSTDLPVADFMKAEASSGFFMHPYIRKTMLHLQSEMHSDDKVYKFDGLKEEEISRKETSSDASDSCNKQNLHSECVDVIFKSDEVKQLIKARQLGVLELSPTDEMEGEIIYLQHKLLCKAVARKRRTDNLVCMVGKSLPQEIDESRRQRWDTVVVNQYFCELREAKKQGRKEKRHKEAQAVLAAATAAAAASSRSSAFRKDALEESVAQELSSRNRRAGISSQVMSRAKETLSRLAVPRVLSEKNSSAVTPVSKEHPRSCDICRRSETVLNPVLVCSSCKVAVHLDCYRSVKESTGPWQCEVCEESSSRSSGALSTGGWENSVAECGLCGGTSGAFRKSADGQWIHAFCAEWIFESTFRRGQVNPVTGVETVPKGIDTCCVCHRNHGVCIKCSYGHCQTTFHPYCAKSYGYYMNVKNGGGHFQHKAYCQKHGVEQRTKAEAQKHGTEEFKSIKQVRVELERLRLLCERIIKREKLKREVVLCSHEILAFKREHAVRSMHGRTPFFFPDVSSESATTSLKGSEAVQRSDDGTVDSSASVKHRTNAAVSMDADQKTDDSYTSQSLLSKKPSERVQFSGKQIPVRALASRSFSNDEEWSSSARKPTETIGKEIVMTQDQASLKNRQLPKGYFYIPLNCLPKEKQDNQDASSVEPDG